ncbi:MAG: dihydrolipoamide dehydrogenase [Gammaproteobacteria bacterium RIFCSPHIGHO2_12_FULL_37_14]|nr:MAG: dihydrolipoamide dehydrogenase [Gammaproteobacteria bacterium RIFCSPHIGHO2_12_FULL_37_14]
MNSIKCDLAVIGAGAGGLSVAAGAAQLGIKVVLIENDKMGGDCLNYGCVPSKSLLAAAKAAHHFRTVAPFGIKPIEPDIDFAKVMNHVSNVINIIGTTKDSIERFTHMGVKVIQAHGQFVNPYTLKAGDTTLTARRFVIATGSSPAIPPIQGLDKIVFYTNETIFNITKKPEHLIIIGGGPIGCELGQAFLMLGSKVTLLEGNHILSHDEEDLVDMLRTHLKKQGMEIFENTKTIKVAQKDNQIEIFIEKNGQQQTIIGSDLLIATGRRVNVDGLNLEAAKISYTKKGIQVDSKLRTSNKHVYAVGDVASSYQFTHLANYHAGIVIRNILFRLPAKVDYRALPWVTYTEPELAHVGVSSKEVEKQGSTFKSLLFDFAEVDRALAENQTLGKIKVITNKHGKILGVTILGSHAGELLVPWISAIQEGKSIRSMINIIVPYPTLSEVNKFVANKFYSPIIFSNKVKWLVKFLQIFG